MDDCVGELMEPASGDLDDIVERVSHGIEQHEVVEVVS